MPCGPHTGRKCRGWGHPMWQGRGPLSLTMIQLWSGCFVPVRYQQFRAACGLVWVLGCASACQCSSGAGTGQGEALRSEGCAPARSLRNVKARAGHPQNQVCPGPGTPFPRLSLFIPGRAFWPCPPQGLRSGQEHSVCPGPIRVPLTLTLFLYWPCQVLQRAEESP